MVTKRVSLQDQEEAVKLFGPHDKNLKELERRFGVQIFVRPGGMDSMSGLALAVRGRPRQVDQALSTLEEMKRQAGRGRQNGHGHEESVEVPPQGVPAARAGGDTVYVTITGRPIRPQTETQARYVEAIRAYDMVFGIGPAGTGKTYLAVACAVAALETGRCSRIVLTRPIVEAGEKLGFLPGDFYEKVHPYLKPLYDAFYSMVGPDKFRQLRDDEIIEIIPLAYMRGRTLDNAFVILDEAQNTTPEQIKMFLTRLGNGSRMVVTGDPTQVDLEDKSRTGLLQAEEVLRGVEGVSFVRFQDVDVVRHGLVRSVIRAYQAWEDRRAEERKSASRGA
jgi:phosphate starvation-inducible protein PhoH and related proteins